MKDKMQEEFISRLKEIYKNEDYDFSKTEFKGLNENVIFHCNVHNIDLIKKAQSLINGCGCHLCRRTGHKYTNEEWRILAKIERPEYDASESTYIDKSHKVEVYCHKKDENGVEHGKFSVFPNLFLRGQQDCPKCRKERERETKEKNFLEKIKVIYEDKDYDFSKIRYVNASTPVEIVCNKHNVTFYPRPGNILGSHTCCPKCGIEKICDKRRLTVNEIIARIKEKFGNKLDCSKVVQPKNTESKITLICHEKDENGNEHGEFQITPHSLFSSKYACPKCACVNIGLNGRISNEEFLDKVKKIHYGKNFDWSLTHYTKYEDYVKVICNETDRFGNKHGEFKVKAGNLLNGNGCPLCNSSHLEQTVRADLLMNNIQFEQYKRFEWLGLQSLDFYLPECGIGIECQGSQHFKDDFFKSKGIEFSKNLFKETTQRDSRKKQLCKENNVELIYFLDKKYVGYMSDGDIYFTDVKKLTEYLTNKLVTV